MEYHIVKYSGPFGFIKPWTAVRDSETFSQQFLTPSIVAGIERKLFPELLNEPFGIYKIKSHRLSYDRMDGQQEQIQPRGWNKSKNTYSRDYAILVRSVLLNPVLWLAFENEKDAERANRQHICLCRNEDILYPTLENIEQVSSEDFISNDELFNGFELVFEKNEKSFLVGYNRFENGSPMHGWLRVVGNPINTLQ
ncbi:MAG: hypothetical protein KDC57_05920 [Saprospiraceae bacterium]|nr:hypothetical protein [Saprospiraceae bacterium]